MTRRKRKYITYAKTVRVPPFPLSDEDQRLIAAMPISFVDLNALFSHLNVALNSGPCDTTLRHTEAFLSHHQLDPATVVPWLQSFGGFCDCEVLYNVEPDWWYRITAMLRKSTKVRKHRAPSTSRP